MICHSCGKLNLVWFVEITETNHFKANMSSDSRPESPISAGRSLKRRPSWGAVWALVLGAALLGSLVGYDLGVPAAKVGESAYVYRPGTTTIESGYVLWAFEDLRGNLQVWNYSIDSYRAYVDSPHPSQALWLNTGTSTVLVNDPRPYVQPALFASVISDLTRGRSAHEFVREAFNVKTSFIRYAKGLGDENGSYKFPSETLTEGTGICGDTSILLSSLIIAGSDQAGYGLSVKLWIAELADSGETLVPTPKSPNHAFIEVSYADGSVEYVETTASWFLWNGDAAHGWPLEISR